MTDVASFHFSEDSAQAFAGIKENVERIKGVLNQPLGIPEGQFNGLEQKIHSVVTKSIADLVKLEQRLERVGTIGGSPHLTKIHNDSAAELARNLSKLGGQVGLSQADTAKMVSEVRGEFLKYLKSEFKGATTGATQLYSKDFGSGLIQRPSNAANRELAAYQQGVVEANKTQRVTNISALRGQQVIERTTAEYEGTEKAAKRSRRAADRAANADEETARRKESANQQGRNERGQFRPSSNVNGGPGNRDTAAAYANTAEGRTTRARDEEITRRQREARNQRTAEQEAVYQEDLARRRAENAARPAPAPWRAISEAGEFRHTPESAVEFLSPAARARLGTALQQTARGGGDVFGGAQHPDILKAFGIDPNVRITPGYKVPFGFKDEDLDLSYNFKDKKGKTQIDYKKRNAVEDDFNNELATFRGLISPKRPADAAQAVQFAEAAKQREIQRVAEEERAQARAAAQAAAPPVQEDNRKSTAASRKRDETAAYKVEATRVADAQKAAAEQKAAEERETKAAQEAAAAVADRARVERERAEAAARAATAQPAAGHGADPRLQNVIDVAAGEREKYVAKGQRIADANLRQYLEAQEPQRFEFKTNRAANLLEQIKAGTPDSPIQVSGRRAAIPQTELPLLRDELDRRATSSQGKIDALKSASSPDLAALKQEETALKDILHLRELINKASAEHVDPAIARHSRYMESVHSEADRVEQRALQFGKETLANLDARNVPKADRKQVSEFDDLLQFTRKHLDEAGLGHVRTRLGDEEELRRLNTAAYYHPGKQEIVYGPEGVRRRSPEEREDLARHEMAHARAGTDAAGDGGGHGPKFFEAYQAFGGKETLAQIQETYKHASADGVHDALDAYANGRPSPTAGLAEKVAAGRQQREEERAAAEAAIAALEPAIPHHATPVASATREEELAAARQKIADNAARYDELDRKAAEAARLARPAVPEGTQAAPVSRRVRGATAGRLGNEDEAARLSEIAHAAAAGGTPAQIQDDIRHRREGHEARKEFDAQVAAGQVTPTPVSDENQRRQTLARERMAAATETSATTAEKTATTTKAEATQQQAADTRTTAAKRAAAIETGKAELAAREAGEAAQRLKDARLDKGVGFTRDPNNAGSYLNRTGFQISKDQDTGRYRVINPDGGVPRNFSSVAGAKSFAQGQIKDPDSAFRQNRVTAAGDDAVALHRVLAETARQAAPGRGPEYGTDEERKALLSRLATAMNAQGQALAAAVAGGGGAVPPKPPRKAAAGAPEPEPEPEPKPKARRTRKATAPPPEEPPAEPEAKPTRKKRATRQFKVDGKGATEEEYTQALIDDAAPNAQTTGKKKTAPKPAPQPVDEEPDISRRVKNPGHQQGAGQGGGGAGPTGPTGPTAAGGGGPRGGSGAGASGGGGGGGGGGTSGGSGGQSAANAAFQLFDSLDQLLPQFREISNGRYVERASGKYVQDADRIQGTGQYITGKADKYLAQRDDLLQNGGVKATDSSIGRLQRAIDLFDQNTVNGLATGVRQIGKNLFEDLRTGQQQFVQTDRRGGREITDPQGILNARQALDATNTREANKAEREAKKAEKDANVQRLRQAIDPATGGFTSNYTNVGKNFLRDATGEYFQVVGKELRSLANEPHGRKLAQDQDRIFQSKSANEQRLIQAVNPAGGYTNQYTNLGKNFLRDATGEYFQRVGKELRELANDPHGRKLAQDQDRVFQTKTANEERLRQSADPANGYTDLGKNFLRDATGEYFQKIGKELRELANEPHGRKLAQEQEQVFERKKREKQQEQADKASLRNAYNSQGDLDKSFRDLGNGFVRRFGIAQDEYFTARNGKLTPINPVTDPHTYNQALNQNEADAGRRVATRQKEEDRQRLQNAFVSPGLLRPDLTDIGHSFFRQDLEDGTRRFYQKIGDTLRDVTNDAGRQGLALRADAESRAHQSKTGAFISGLTSGGIGGNGEVGIQGLLHSAGTTLKYTALYGTLGLVQQALHTLVTEMLNFEDSTTGLDLALKETGGASKDFLNDLGDIATIAGSNIGDVMDIASVGIRAFGAEVAASGGDVEQFGVTFAREAQKMSLIANTTVKDAAGNIRASVSGFGLGPGSITRITDAVTHAKRLGGTPEDISQGLASFAEGASSAGISPELAGDLVAKVTSASDRTGQAVGTSLTRIFTIAGGQAGQAALARANQQVKSRRGALGQPDSDKDVIDSTASTGDQIKQLAVVYNELSGPQQKLINNQIAGTNSAREFTATLKFLKGALSDEELQTDAAGKSQEEYQKLLDNVAAKVKEFQGALSLLLVQLSQSGVLDPIIFGFIALTKVIESVTKLIEIFNDAIPRGARRAVFAIGEIAIALKLVNSLMASGALRSIISAGASRFATQSAAAAAAARAGGAGGIGAAGLAGLSPAAARAEQNALRFAGAGPALPAPPAAGPTVRSVLRTPVSQLGRAEGGALLRGAGTTLKGIATSLNFPLIAAVGGLLAIGAIKGKVDEFGRNVDEINAVNNDYLMAGTQVEDNPERTRLADLTGVVARGKAAADVAEKSNNSFLGKTTRLVTGKDTEAEVTNQRGQVAIAESQIKELSDQADAANNVNSALGKLAVFGDPAALTLESITSGVAQLTANGASASEVLDSVAAALGAIGGAGDGVAVDKVRVSQSALGGLAILQDYQFAKPEAKQGGSPQQRGRQAARDAEDTQKKTDSLNALINDPKAFAAADKALKAVLPDTTKDPDHKLTKEEKDAALKAGVASYLQSYHDANKDADPGELIPDAELEKILRGTLNKGLQGNVTNALPKGAKLPSDLLTGLADIVEQQLQTDLGRVSDGDQEAIKAAYDRAIKQEEQYLKQKIPGQDTSAYEERLAKLKQARTDSVIADAEKTLAADQSRATSQKEFAAIGNAFLQKNLVLAANEGSVTSLIALMDKADTYQIAIARKVLTDKLALDRKTHLGNHDKAVAEILASGKYGNSIESYEANDFNKDVDANTAGRDAKDGLDIKGDKKAVRNFDKALGQASPSETGKGTANYDPRFLQRDAERRNALADSDNALDAAQRSLDDATAELGELQKKDDQYWSALKKQTDAMNGLAKARREDALNSAKLDIDLTNPVQVADAELKDARKETRRVKALAADPKNIGKGKLYATQEAADAAVHTAELAEASSTNSRDGAKQQEFLSNLQNAEKYGRISHQTYLQGLDNEARRVKQKLAKMKNTDNGYKQLQDYLNSLTDAAKAAADQLSGQFNLGDIDVPSVYEVRSALKNRDKGSILGDNPANSTSGNVTNDTSQRTVILNGVPLQQVLAIVEDMFGKKAKTNVSRRNS